MLGLVDIGVDAAPLDLAVPHVAIDVRGALGPLGQVGHAGGNGEEHYQAAGQALPPDVRRRASEHDRGAQNQESGEYAQRIVGGVVELPGAARVGPRQSCQRSAERDQRRQLEGQQSTLRRGDLGRGHTGSDCSLRARHRQRLVIR